MALLNSASSQSLLFSNSDLVVLLKKKGGRLSRSESARVVCTHGPLTSSTLQSDSSTPRRGAAKKQRQLVVQHVVVEERAASAVVDVVEAIPAESLLALSTEGSLSSAEMNMKVTTLPMPDGEALPQQRQRELGTRHRTKKVVTSKAILRQTTPDSRSRLQVMLSTVCDMAETFIPLIEPQERTLRTDPRIQLEGNFAPVDESPPQGVLAVRGTIPRCFNGAYIRNGGNPKFTPTAGFHVFDGDGMLHVVRIKDGEATHCCRFTKTNRLQHEERAGRPLFTKALGELEGLGGMARFAVFSLRGLAGQADLSKGMGSANAGLEFFNGMVLAMSEDDMPYALRVTEDGDVETLGRYNFGGSLKTAMTAHPKIDPKTREMFSFSYDVQKQPYLTYFRVAPNGVKGVEVPINLPEPTVIHDFAITENYAIFPEGQVVFRLQELFNGKSPIFCDEKKVPRFGVLPKNARSEARMRWFDLPDVTCFHYVNAWEEGEEIVVVGSAIGPLPYLFDQPSDLICRLSMYRLNMTTGKARKQQVSNGNLDVGRCNSSYTGRKARYVYMSISGPWPKYSGVAKVDLENPTTLNDVSVDDDSSIAGWRKFPPGCFGSEPYFMPRSSDAHIAEDDGYVVTHYHDENTGVSELLIMDALSPTLETVASIEMPSRVPYGFHGLFLTEEQLALQRSSLP